MRKVRGEKKDDEEETRARARVQGEGVGGLEGGNGCREGTWRYAIFLPTFPKEFIAARYALSYFRRMQQRGIPEHTPSRVTRTASRTLPTARSSRSRQVVGRHGVDATRDTLEFSRRIHTSSKSLSSSDTSHVPPRFLLMQGLSSKEEKKEDDYCFAKG